MTLKEKIYNELYNDISSGKYQQNEILSESQLIEKYHVSKSPIREALLELCKDGVLQSLPRLGYQVLPVTLKEVLDVLEYRIDMETSGLKRAFYSITPEQLEVLKQMSYKTDEEVVNPDWSKNEAFHLKLYEMNHNKYGYQELERTLKKSSRFIAQYFQAAWKKANAVNIQCHGEIVECIRAKDLDGACGKLREDIASIKEEIQKMHEF